MSSIAPLLANNAAWAAARLQENPNYFQDLAAVHSPGYLWIGCSDARVPANTLLGLKPGEVFVHRNIANQVLPVDLNCLAVVQHAVEALRVKDIIICGHYGCGGIQGALGLQGVGTAVDFWLTPLKELSKQHRKNLLAIPDPIQRANRLSEINTRQQVLNLSQTTVVQEAWRAGRDLTVHGLIYAIEDGLLRGLNLCVSGKKDLEGLMESPASFRKS